MEGGETIHDGPGGGRTYDDDRPDSPASFEEIERPPLRKIDKYCKAECPCMSARYTIATMACIGFMIAFGMRCNMSAAKLKGEHNGVSEMVWRSVENQISAIRGNLTFSDMYDICYTI